MLGDKIKALRKSQGLNQTEFANNLSVTPGAVSQWETGRSTPDTERLIAMSKLFSVPLDYFSDGERTGDQLLTQEILDKLNDLPKTPEAKAVSFGMDTLPKEKRELILNMVTAMFPNNFTKGTNNDEA